MAKSAVRIGVAGVGFGSQVHIPAFQSEGVEVVAVCAGRKANAEQAAGRFGITNVFDDFQAMLAMDALDAVSIATPPHLHQVMVCAALKAGKHVLCEKPFSLDAGEARTMQDLAVETGLTTMVAHEFRFASARMRAKELIGEGFVGEPKLVRAYLAIDGFGSGSSRTTAPPVYHPVRDAASHGGGLLGALGSHYVDGLIHWFGRVTSVSAELSNLSPLRMKAGEPVSVDVDNLYMLHLKFESGLLGELLGSTGLPFGTGAGIEVYGSDGTLTTPQGGGWNPPAHGKILGAQRGDGGLHRLTIPKRLQPFVDDRDPRLMPFRLLVRQFLLGIATGTSPSPNFEDALHTQQVLDAARLSSASGARIDIS